MKYLIPTFFILTVSILQAQTPHVYDFLRNDASARSAGMGGAFVTVVNDPVGQLYNPALAYTVDSTQVSFTFLKHILDINSGSAVLGTEMEGIGKIGVGVQFNSYGSFQRSDRNGRSIGEFGSSDLALNLTWATYLGENFQAGLSGEAVYSSIDDYSSVALAINGGLLYNDTSRRLQIGLSLLHLGSQISSYNGVIESLPLDLKIGISHQLRGLPLLIALNFSRLLDETDNFGDRFSSFAIGGEFTIAKPVRLRFGYNNRIRQDVTFGESKGMAGFSAGLGILISGYRIDYSFNSMSGIGMLHRFTVSTGL